MGYRHYESAGVVPLFPFGHGLSYASFDYGVPQIDQSPGRVVVTLELSNTGDRRGTEVVQVYVRPHAPKVARPDRELATFAKVSLDAGQKSTISLELDEMALAYWDTDGHHWAADPGRYELLIGASSRDIRAAVEVSLP